MDILDLEPYVKRMYDENKEPVWGIEWKDVSKINSKTQAVKSPPKKHD